MRPVFLHRVAGRSFGFPRAMDSETPFEDPAPDDGNDAPYQWLDEWLCEYVDGTMDPSLEAVFEQYVEANPELKAHVERLQKTRDLLCQCSRSADVSPEEEPSDWPPDAEPPPPPPSPSSPPDDTRPTVVIGMVSSIAVALVVGFLAGATMVSPSAFSLSSASSPVEQATTAPAPGPSWQQVQAPVPSARPLRGSGSRSSTDSTEQPSSTLTPIGRP
jgi:anti-sigma factor RsiW